MFFSISLFVIFGCKSIQFDLNEIVVYHNESNSFALDSYLFLRKMKVRTSPWIPWISVRNLQDARRFRPENSGKMVGRWKQEYGDYFRWRNSCGYGRFWLEAGESCHWIWSPYYCFHFRTIFRSFPYGSDTYAFTWVVLIFSSINV
jgi:hypothetical protein